MSDTLKIALICIAIGAAIGIPVSFLFSKPRSGRPRRFTNTRARKIHIVGLVLCAMVAARNFAQGQPYLGGLFAALGALGFSVMLTSGIRSLTKRRNRPIGQVEVDHEAHDE